MCDSFVAFHVATSYSYVPVIELQKGIAHRDWNLAATWQLGS